MASLFYKFIMLLKSAKYNGIQKNTKSTVSINFLQATPDRRKKRRVGGYDSCEGRGGGDAFASRLEGDQMHSQPVVVLTVPRITEVLTVPRIETGVLTVPRIETVELTVPEIETEMLTVPEIQTEVQTEIQTEVPNLPKIPYGKQEMPVPLCFNKTILSEVAFSCSTEYMYKNIDTISRTTSNITENNTNHHKVLAEDMEDSLISEFATLLIQNTIKKSEKKKLRKLTKFANVSAEVGTVTQPKDILIANCIDTLAKSLKIIHDVNALLTDNNDILRSLLKSEKYLSNKIRRQERSEVIKMKARRKKMERHLKNNETLQPILIKTQKLSRRKLGRLKSISTSKQQKHVPDSTFRASQPKKHVLPHHDLEQFLSDNTVRVPPIENNDLKILNIDNTETLFKLNIEHCSNRKELKRSKYLSYKSDIDTTRNKPETKNMPDSENPYFVEIVEQMQDIFAEGCLRVPPVTIHSHSKNNEILFSMNHKYEVKKTEILEADNGDKLFNENVSSKDLQTGTKYKVSQTGGYNPKDNSKDKSKESPDDVTVLKETYSEPIGNFNPLQNQEKVHLCNIHHLKYTPKSNDPVYDNVEIAFMKPKYESLKHIRGDGNCLFRAIAYCITNDENDHTAIRQSIVSHRNDQSCKKYICKTRGITATELENHIRSQNMNRSSVWGTDIEIAAACHLFQTQILTFENTNRWTVFGKTFVNRCMYLDHSSQCHYDVVTDVIDANTNTNPAKNNASAIQIFDQVIEGNMSQNHLMFEGIGQGKQCYANSLSFLLMLQNETHHEINAEFITDVLVRGNILYNSIISQNPTPTGYLEIFDIPKILSFNNKNYTYKSRQQQGYLEYWNYTEEDDQGLTLHEAIEKVLTDYNACLVTFLNTTTCVMKNKSIYYSFDPHSRDEQGRINVLGNAIVHMSNSLEKISLFLWNTAESLTDSIINRTNAKHGFSVDGITFEECRKSKQIKDQNFEPKLSTISSKIKCRNDQAKNEVKNLTASQPSMSSKSARRTSCKKKLNFNENIDAHQKKESQSIEPLSDHEQNVVDPMSLQIKESYVRLCKLTCKRGQLVAGKCDKARMHCTKNTVNNQE
ncbi:unnamed protein product, partial [Owenia fusiformis]